MSGVDITVNGTSPLDPALDGTAVNSLLDEIAAVGRDPQTGGYRRFAFTREDVALGEWFEDACRVRGLDVTTDRCGNQWAWWGDPDVAVAAGRPGIVTGSHLDSVPDGGPMDGPLGTASALAALDLLRAQGFTPTRPIGLVRFVDEEGGRYGLACSGSRLLTGISRPETVLGLTDAAGSTYAEGLRGVGLDPAAVGRDDETLRRVGVFVELHVEQGRWLSRPDVDRPVAAASLIKAHGRWRVDLLGKADHAGATRLEDRDDPMLELARFVPAVRAAAAAQGAVGTVGKLDVRPNAVNAIPSRVTAWLDCRADTEEQVHAVLADLAGQGFGIIEESWSPATLLDPALGDRVAAAAGRAVGRDAAAPPVPVIPTGAGHDAGVLSQHGVAAAMLFVRNPTGTSHAPDEFAEPDDRATGVRALAAVLADLCG
ncbi:allantoate amidohydrolase [Kineosporia sp. A_224]|uniref:allantoate amidohydrolase n=1 Tax=Kineosporia sp. A_224 TaxID=1962180 RepID=UPI000B4A67A1